MIASPHAAAVRELAASDPDAAELLFPLSPDAPPTEQSIMARAHRGSFSMLPQSRRAALVARALAMWAQVEAEEGPLPAPRPATAEPAAVAAAVDREQQAGRTASPRPRPGGGLPQPVRRRALRADEVGAALLEGSGHSVEEVRTFVGGLLASAPDAYAKRIADLAGERFGVNFRAHLRNFRFAFMRRGVERLDPRHAKEALQVLEEVPEGADVVPARLEAIAARIFGRDRAAEIASEAASLHRRRGGVVRGGRLTFRQVRDIVRPFVQSGLGPEAARAAVLALGVADHADDPEAFTAMYYTPAVASESGRGSDDIGRKRSRVAGARTAWVHAYAEGCFRVDPRTPFHVVRERIREEWTPADGEFPVGAARFVQWYLHPALVRVVGGCEAWAIRTAAKARAATRPPATVQREALDVLAAWGARGASLDDSESLARVAELAREFSRVAEVLE